MNELFDSQISQFITRQFPETYVSNGPVFIAFVQAYYEWLQQSNNIIGYAKNIPSLTDVDETLDQFIIHFKNEYMSNLPTNIVVDQRLLIKNIVDLYRSKGSKRGYELLFRIFFNEDIKLYLPGSNIFKLSDNQFIQDKYLEVSDSIYLQNLVSFSIKTNTGFAIVEDYHILTIKNRVINILTLSNVEGTFSYGDYILSDDVPALGLSNAPRIIGSLSQISIEEGGIYYNVGDLLSVNGSGSGAIARVASTKNENGKIIFKLINGGFGFSMNPTITVNGGNGYGASFKVGTLTNQSVYVINLDVVNTYYNTQLDIASEGFSLNISNASGSFTNGEIITSSANGIGLDFAYLTGNAISNGETLSNTSLGISGLKVIHVDNPSYLNLTGPEASLNNANLLSGAILIGSVSNDVIYVNSVIPKTQYIANGTAISVNSTVIAVNNANGYFLPTSNISGLSSGKTAYLNSTTRKTNWIFPSGGISNLDSTLFNVLTYENLIVGSIASITAENPGDLYASNPTVYINEPLISQLQLPDGLGGIWGDDAIVTANAVNANGIITAVQVMDSGFGYNPNENLELTSLNPILNQTYATGVAIVDSQGISQGYLTGEQSMLSSHNYLQDSYYYQIFSYEIFAPRMLASYQQFLTDLMHPVGFQMFGRYWLNDIKTTNTQISYELVTQANGGYSAS